MSAAPGHDLPEQRPTGWLPLGLVVAALLLLAIYQTVGLVRDHYALVQVHAAQQSPVEQTQKVRATLQTIATRTAQLAANGDAAARDVLDVMHSQGVTVSLPKK